MPQSQQELTQDQIHAFEQAIQGIIPDEQYQFNPELRSKNKYGCTIAMYLAVNGIIPPKQWQHKPELTFGQGWTVAMLLADKGVIPPKEWRHDPNMVEQTDGSTVAMLLTKNGLDVPEQWYHDKYIRNNKDYTMQMLLHKQNKDIPEHWQYPSVFDFQDNSPAMIQAKNGQIPSKENYHDPKQTNIWGDTVAIFLMQNNIEVPQEWLYEPEYILSNGINKFTTAIKLSSKGVVPNDYWMHDVNKEDECGNSIRNNLYQYNYIYQDGKFVYNVQTEIKQDKCCICLNDGEQEFIKTICGHNVCMECFNELLKQRKQHECPECRQENWFVPIDKYQYQRSQIVNIKGL